MHRLRLLLPIGFVVIATLAACKKKENKPAEPTPATDPNAAAVTPPEPKPPEPVKPPEPTNTTDVDVTPARLNLEEHTEWKPVPSLPKGAQMAVLEGAPPFAEGKSFAFLLKFPKGYKVPPHTHAVTERVTVLSGSIHFGHGEKLDQKKGKHIKAGGIVLIPAGHAHYVWTTEEMVLQLQGVGPWGIYYIDPKDDPRQPAVAKPEGLKHDTDSDLESAEYNPADIKWNPGPASLPAGAEIAALEGAPPFGPGKSFVFRLKFPDGYKIPVHHHLVTERVNVLSGTLGFGMGDTWNDADLKPIKAGGVVYMPREHKHFVQAKGETVVQVQGVGPWGIVYANPDEDPRNAKK
jgi:quercetin dioxygenase-like cupin family protein